MHKLLLAGVMMLAGWGTGAAQAGERQISAVAELYTSQSCSSCPPADEVLAGLVGEKNILALSFHVDYWDHLGWKDTYSAPEYTQRQRDYALAMQRDGVFTPQIIVNGQTSVLGSHGSAVKDAINGNSLLTKFKLSLVPQGGKLAVNINALSATTNADIWEVHFDKQAQVKIGGGENGGRVLNMVNNVVLLRKLAGWTPQGKTPLLIDIPTRDSVAIIIQTQNLGPILGAVVYDQF